MKKTIATLAICGLAAVGASTTAHAGPTCSDIGPWANHGGHVTGDYVDPPGPDGIKPAAPAGDPGVRGAPAHPELPFAPGASFCLDSNSPGVHLG